MAETRIRLSTLADAVAVRALHQQVSAVSGGLARQPDEITAAYVEGFLTKAGAQGIGLVAEDPTTSAIVGELHTYSAGLRIFAHVLGELTVAVAPAWQGRGVGRALFAELLRLVQTDWPHIRRVELLAAESNAGAIRLYEQLGFRREGRLEGRVARNGQYEADIALAWHAPGV